VELRNKISRDLVIGKKSPRARFKYYDFEGVDSLRNTANLS